MGVVGGGTLMDESRKAYVVYMFILLSGRIIYLSVSLITCWEIPWRRELDVG